MAFRAVGTISKAPCVIVAATFSPDDKYLIVSGSDKKLRVVETASGTERWAMDVKYVYFHRPAWSPDSTRFALLDTNLSVAVMYDADGSNCQVFTLHSSLRRTTAMVWSPDGRQLATTSRQRNTIELFDLHTRQSRQCFQTDGLMQCLAWCGSSGRMACGTAGSNKIVVFEPTSGKVDFTGRDHMGPVVSVAWHPDGKMVASGSHDGTVRLWDASNGNCSQRLCFHACEVIRVGFTRDGTRLFSRTSQDVMFLGRLPLGLRKIEMFEKIDCIELSCDGNTLFCSFRKHDGAKNMLFRYTGWSDFVHYLFGKEYKKLVFFLMCIAQGDAAPMQTWLAIFAYLFFLSESGIAIKM